MSKYYICDGCEKIALGDNRKHKYHISLKIGDVININGVLYEYLGFGVLGTDSKEEPKK